MFIPNHIISILSISLKMSNHSENSDNSEQQNNSEEIKVMCNPSELQEGEWLSGTVYYKIITPQDEIKNGTMRRFRIIDSFGKELSVGGPILGREMVSAQQYDRTVKISRTEMIEKLMSARDSVFTVKFKKQLNGKRLREQLEEEKYNANDPSPKRTKICNKVIKMGEDRTLTGYLTNTEPLMGRSQVIDLGLGPVGKHSTRLVDHRTVDELILRRVRYVLK